MLFFVFGLPGEFSRWCETVVTELARRADPSAALSHADTLDQIARNAIRTGISHGVVSSSQPGGRLRAALATTQRNFIVAFDNPRLALIDLVLGRGVGLPAAIQALASSSAALIGVGAAPGALALHGDRDWPARTDMVAAIARHLGIIIDEAEIAELVARLPDGTAARPQYDTAAWWAGLDAAQQELPLGALAPFIDAPADGVPLSIAWGRDLFFLGDRPDQRAAGPVDITGRARCLLHGPYIMIPAGAWSLSLTARFSGAAVEHEFTVEVGADYPLASGIIRPEPDGNGEVTLDFLFDERTEFPIALRLSSQRAAFDGAILVREARLMRRAG